MLSVKDSPSHSSIPGESEQIPRKVYQPIKNAASPLLWLRSSTAACVSPGAWAAGNVQCVLITHSFVTGGVKD